jgi:hypothetical protein
MLGRQLMVCQWSSILIVAGEHLESGKLLHHLAGLSIPDGEARPRNLEVTLRTLPLDPLLAGVAEKHAPVRGRLHNCSRALRRIPVRPLACSCVHR